MSAYILFSFWPDLNLNIKVIVILYHRPLWLDYFRIWDTDFITFKGPTKAYRRHEHLTSVQLVPKIGSQNQTITSVTVGVLFFSSADPEILKYPRVLPPKNGEIALWSATNRWYGIWVDEKLRLCSKTYSPTVSTFVHAKRAIGGSRENLERCRACGAATAARPWTGVDTNGVARLLYAYIYMGTVWRCETVQIRTAAAQCRGAIQQGIFTAQTWCESCSQREGLDVVSPCHGCHLPAGNIW